MIDEQQILEDSFGRVHRYLRISLTEKCNLRCTYCMPADGVLLSPRKDLMSAEEIYAITKMFVKHGVTKIRLTGGEPLVRKDFSTIVERLSELPVELTLTTNAILIDRFIPLLKQYSVFKINVSLDSLDPLRFKKITLRDHFNKVMENIDELIRQNFQVKVNVVLMKGFNDDEVISFINLTKDKPITVRFIEFMPFDGNQWSLNQIVSYKDIMNQVANYFPSKDLIRLQDAPNDTAKNYKIKGFKGDFGVISSVTNPFCDSCNRLRLTANGKLKNCLFSNIETDLLHLLREGRPLEKVVKHALLSKYKTRAGMDQLTDFSDVSNHSENRSMITIGG